MKVDKNIIITSGVILGGIGLTIFGIVKTRQLKNSRLDLVKKLIEEARTGEDRTDTSSTGGINDSLKDKVGVKKYSATELNKVLNDFTSELITKYNESWVGNIDEERVIELVKLIPSKVHTSQLASAFQSKNNITFEDALMKVGSYDYEEIQTLLNKKVTSIPL